MDNDTEISAQLYYRLLMHELQWEFRKNPDEVQTKRTFDERIQQRMRDLPEHARSRSRARVHTSPRR